MWRFNKFVAVAFVLVGTVDARPPIARVNQGKVRGKLLRSRDGRKFAAFRGIPYAKPPVGELRFTNPEPADSWNGILDATKDAPYCVQINNFLPYPYVAGQEDCLFLNVYIPQIISLKKKAKRPYPVMVYIHGGGWFGGSGNSTQNGPEYFMDRDVILVTLNYRLGIFGFLSTSDDAAPGNWGLKDMTLALKWVQENIQHFCGRADSVTIFGQSAGSASVHFLLLSPQTKGLFHRAISQSGTALSLIAKTVDGSIAARAQALFSGCNANGTSVEIVECLRTVDAGKLLEDGIEFRVWSIEPLIIFAPTVEKKTKINPNPFLPDTPANLIARGEFHKVPYIIGMVENEGLIRSAAITGQSELRDDVNSRWSELGQQMLGLPYSVTHNVSLSPILWENMTDFYMHGERFLNPKDPANIENFMNLYTDRLLVYGIYQAATKHAKLSSKPVYFYRFNFAGRDTWAYMFAGFVDTAVNYVYNKSHGDDLNYFFAIPDIFPEPYPKGSPDCILSHNMVKLWTTFARRGKPAKFWDKLSPDIFQYLDITSPTNMAMRTDFLPERMEFWENQNIDENKQGLKICSFKRKKIH